MELHTASDIFKRPPSIAEDALHYSIFPSDTATDKAAVSALALGLQAFLDSVLKNFIWHRDSFELKVAHEESSDTFYLEGDFRVGDSVDDEWCAVWLLREISSKWDVIIKCVQVTRSIAPRFLRT